MTEVSERQAAPSRTARIPWTLRPWTLFAVNLLCFAVNWGAVVEEPYGFDGILTCRGEAERADVLTVVLAGMCVAAGLTIVLAALWCRRRRAPWAPVVLTAAPLIAFALYNVWMGYVTETVFLAIQVPCTGPLPAS